MSVRFKTWKQPVFDVNGLTKWNWICQHPENLVLGRFVDIGAFSYLNAKFGIKVDRNVQIGSHCSLYTESTIDGKKGSIHLKENCRVGTHSVVMPGVTIGKNSIVGAFSFVTENVPDDVLVFGVPARRIRTLTPA